MKTNTLLYIATIFLTFCASLRMNAQEGWEKIYTDFPSTQSYTPNSFLTLDNGNFITLINSSSVLNSFSLYEIDSFGEVVNSYEIQKEESEYAIEIYRESDGSFSIFVAGQETTADPNYTKIFRLNQQYEYINQITLDNLGQTEIYVDRAVIPNVGSWILSRWYSQGITSRLFKIDENSQQVGNAITDDFELFNCVEVFGTPQGGARVVGFSAFDTPSGSTNTYVLEYDSDGLMVNEFHFFDVDNPDGVFRVRDAAETTDGGLVMLALISSNTTAIVKLDAAGIESWRKKYDHPSGFGVPSRVEPKFDNAGYRLIFQNYSNPLIQNGIVETDLNGEVIWEQNFALNQDVFVTNFWNLPDNSSLILGVHQSTINSENPYPNRPIIIKTDAQGNTLSGEVNGNVEIDDNEDCLGDGVLNGVGQYISLYQNDYPIAVGIVDELGSFNIVASPGTYKLYPQFPNALWSSCSDSIDIVLPANASVDNQDLIIAYNAEPLDSIHGYVFQDENLDCVLDATEQTRYAGWVVSLSLEEEQNGVVLIDTTDAEGHYSFLNIGGFTNGATATINFVRQIDNLLSCGTNCDQELIFGPTFFTTQEINLGLDCRTNYWRENGATWIFSQPGFGGNGAVSASITGDTIILGRDCKKLSAGFQCQALETQFVYEEAGKIFRFNEETFAFHLLYDFHAGEGDSWNVYLNDQWGLITVTVDSVGTKEYDGQLFDVQYVHSTPDGIGFGPEIIKGIGSAECLFPQLQFCDFVTSGIRCYDSPGTGLINFVNGADCNLSTLPANEINGFVFEDVDLDCTRDLPEGTGYDGWIVTLELVDGSDTVSLADTTNQIGYYEFLNIQAASLQTEIFISFVAPANTNLDCFSNCPENFTITQNGLPNYFVNHGVRCDPLIACNEPIMEAAISTYLIRPCKQGTYYVNYCNIGGAVAEMAYAEVSIDPALTIISSSVPWSNQNGNVLTYDFGDLGINQCDTFSIQFETACDDPTGQAYCTEIYAYPDSTCQEALAQWSGAEVAVSSVCLGDSIKFEIENIGSGDMQEALEYIIIEDNVLLMTVPFQLDIGEMLSVSVPNEAYYYRLEAQQAVGFPGVSKPAAWVAGCNGMGPINGQIVNQYALGDQDTWYDVFCLESVNSFDPNDKTGFPIGTGNQNNIDKGEPLEYVIRFQNTGTAEAIDIEIRDTLPAAHLDWTSVRPGASSHAYEWNMEGIGVVVFKFKNINLPDSMSNPEGSQGFVQFKVQQLPDLPIGTEILNTAAIYFDNNAPIITNQTLHTIGEPILDGVQNPLHTASVIEVDVIPNPFQEQFKIHLINHPINEKIKLEIYDAIGKNIISKTIENGKSIFSNEIWTPGIYFFKCTTTDNQVATGKLIKIPTH